MEDKPKAIEGEIVEVDTTAIDLGSAGRPGRPTDMTPDTVAKLIAAFNNGFNITEACQYASIDRTTYYRWLEKDDQFSYKMSVAQAAPNKLAKQLVMKTIQDGDANLALRYLTLRDPDFKPKGALEIDPNQARTENKLKEFMDDTDDGAYPDPADDVSSEPTAASELEGGDEVAPGPTDIS